MKHSSRRDVWRNRCSFWMTLVLARHVRFEQRNDQGGSLPWTAPRAAGKNKSRATWWPSGAPRTLATTARLPAFSHLNENTESDDFREPLCANNDRSWVTPQGAHLALISTLTAAYVQRRIWFKWCRSWRSRRSPLALNDESPRLEAKEKIRLAQRVIRFFGFVLRSAVPDRRPSRAVFRKTFPTSNPHRT